MLNKKWLKFSIFIILALSVFVIINRTSKISLGLKVNTGYDEMIQVYYDNLTDTYPFDEQHSQKTSSSEREIFFDIPLSQANKIRIDFDGNSQDIVLEEITVSFLGKQLKKFVPEEIVQVFNEVNNVKVTNLEDKVLISKIGLDPFIVNNNLDLGKVKLFTFCINVVISSGMALVINFILQNSLNYEVKKKIFKNKKELMLIGMFMGFILLPNLLSNKRISDVTSENRVLKEKPKLMWDNITTYSREYEEYYNDHLPFKNELSKLNSILKYKFLNIAANQSVLKGEDGWLFYNSKAKNDADTLADYMGTNYYTLEELEQIKYEILEKKNYLEKQNVEFYIVIAPNKSNVYERYMPSNYSRINKTTRTDQLVEYLRDNTNVSIIYLKDILVAQAQNRELYYKLDTHWNNIGGYVGFDEIMKVIDGKFVSTSIEQLQIIQEQITSGDLAGMINMNGVLQDTNYTVIDYKPDIVSQLIEEKGSQLYRYISNSNRDEKLLMFRDSFASAIIPYINKEFRESLFIWSHNFDKKVIEEEKPDVVVLEIVERYVDVLKNP